MNSIFYVGMDVHKKTVAVCVKTREGEVVQDLTIDATRKALGAWAGSLDGPWVGAMEATRRTARVRVYGMDLRFSQAARAGVKGRPPA